MTKRMDLDQESERRIKKAFKRKGWSEVKANDSWAIFKIMSEFVEGFEAMQRIRPCVSIFGSARTKPEAPEYVLAEEIAFQLTGNGYGVITGGGPGIMEAANKGRSTWRWHQRGAQHRPALRTRTQPVHRQGEEHQLRLLLRAEGDVHQIQPGLHRAAWRLRHLDELFRSADPDPDPEDRALPHHPGRPHVLAGPRLDWIKTTMGDQHMPTSIPWTWT
jgi:hypothetical protein